MNNTSRVAVCSRSFSIHPALRAELLERYSHVTFNDAGAQLKGDSLVRFLAGHNKAIIALETISDSVLAELPELQVISKYGVGLDMIDLPAMRKYGKRLGWTAGVNRRSVSELVISTMIAMLRHLPEANREMLAGQWRQHVGSQLSGRTVGIIGCGHVGKDLAILLRAFDCKLMANDIRDYGDFYAAHGIISVSLDELLSSADVVSLHVPLDSSTREMLNAQKLALMRPTAVLINAARGGLIDEVALKQMLQSKRLAAAAFDVFAPEPPLDKELLSLPNFFATPHLGGSAAEAILAMGRAAIDGLDTNAIPVAQNDD